MINYYKLMQTDFNGESTEYGPVAVKNCGQTAVLDFDVISQQTSHTELLVKVPADGRYRIGLFAIDGRLVYSIEASLDAGHSLVSLPHRALSRAVYILKVEGNSGVLSKKSLLGKL